MSLDRIKPLVGGLGGDNRVLPHLQEFHERLPDGAVVFDDQNNGGSLAHHGWIIVRSRDERYRRIDGHRRS
jgi:hypothetical protein